MYSRFSFNDILELRKFAFKSLFLKKIHSLNLTSDESFVW